MQQRDDFTPSTPAFSLGGFGVAGYSSGFPANTPAPASPARTTGGGGSSSAAPVAPCTPLVPPFARSSVDDTPLPGSLGGAFAPLSRIPYFSQSQTGSQSQSSVGLPVVMEGEDPSMAAVMFCSFPDSTPKENHLPLAPAQPKAPAKSRKRRGAGDDDPRASASGGHAFEGWSGVRAAIPSTGPSQGRTWSCCWCTACSVARGSGVCSVTVWGRLFLGRGASFFFFFFFVEAFPPFFKHVCWWALRALGALCAVPVLGWAGLGWVGLRRVQPLCRPWVRDWEGLDGVVVGCLLVCPATPSQGVPRCPPPPLTLHRAPPHPMSPSSHVYLAEGVAKRIVAPTESQGVPSVLCIPCPNALKKAAFRLFGRPTATASRHVATTPVPCRTGPKQARLDRFMTVIPRQNVNPFLTAGGPDAATARSYKRQTVPSKGRSPAPIPTQHHSTATRRCQCLLWTRARGADTLGWFY